MQIRAMTINRIDENSDDSAKNQITDLTHPKCRGSLKFMFALDIRAITLQISQTIH